MMEEKKFPHNLILENKNKLSITQVEDVDTFDENRIVLYTSDDTLVIDGYDLHIQKLDVPGGELLVSGEVGCIRYEGKEGYGKKGGFFKRMLK